jgi:hypothetical protein
VQAKLDALRAAIATGDIPQNVNFAISLEVLVDFLVRNRVPFRDGRAAAPLDVARVAELAQTFTYRVECWAKSQQVELTPSTKQGRLPTCRAPYETTTWIDCVGERTFANGAKYIGEFRNGMRAGHGTLTYPDGQTYVGDWRDDKYNGQGVLTFPYGDKYVGEFKDGEYHGQGILTFSNGGKNVGKWRNGFFVGSQ